MRYCEPGLVAKATDHDLEEYRNHYRSWIVVRRLLEPLMYGEDLQQSKRMRPRTSSAVYAAYYAAQKCVNNARSIFIARAKDPYN